MAGRGTKIWRTGRHGCLRRHALPQSPRLHTHPSKEHRALESGRLREELGRHSPSPAIWWGPTPQMVTYTHEHTHLQTHTNLHNFTHSYTNIHRYKCTHVYRHRDTHICIYKHRPTGTHRVAHLYTNTHKLIHTYTHMHTYRHTGICTHITHTCTHRAGPEISPSSLSPPARRTASNTSCRNSIVLADVLSFS